MRWMQMRKSVKANEASCDGSRESTPLTRRLKVAWARADVNSQAQVIIWSSGQLAWRNFAG